MRSASGDLKRGKDNGTTHCIDQSRASIDNGLEACSLADFVVGVGAAASDLPVTFVNDRIPVNVAAKLGSVVTSEVKLRASIAIF